MAALTTATGPGTLFSDGKHWIVSAPTASGFIHIKLGTVNRITSRTKAEEEATSQGVQFI